MRGLFLSLTNRLGTAVTIAGLVDPAGNISPGRFRYRLIQPELKKTPSDFPEGAFG